MIKTQSQNEEIRQMEAKDEVSYDVAFEVAFLLWECKHKNKVWHEVRYEVFK